MNQIFTLRPGASINDISTGASWDYDEIYRQVAGRAHALKDLGVKRGNDILISHGGTPEFLADLLAVWHIGGCATCLNTDLTANEQRIVETFLKPALVLSARDVNAEGTNYSTKVVNLANVPPGTVGELNECQLQPDDPALILFTSGTTSRPKGVVHSKSSISAKLQQNLEHLDTNVLDRTLSVLATHFVSGLLSGILTTLSAGKGIYLFQIPGIDGAMRLGRVIDDYEITFLNSTPSFWKVVLKVSNPPLKKTLLQISVSSAPLDKRTWETIIRWAGLDHVFNMYGATETCGWNIGASHPHHEPQTELIGTPWGGEVAIYTAEGKRNAKGKGEILLKTACLMKGYLHQQTLTDEVVKDGWYHTGDLGEIDEQGRVWYLGRCKYEINRAGTMVSPEEVDLLLLQHPSVREICAFGIPDMVSGETVACAITLHKDCEEKANDLRQWCGDRIRPVCIPERWFFMKDIPKTIGGKYNREMVAKACLENKD